MAENLEKKPSKSILKSSSSFEQPDPPAPVKKKHKETKWDEMNIIATLHPADKDYGHMKIEEPKTPYNWEDGAEGGEEVDGLDATLLAEKIRLGASEPVRVFREEDEDDDDDDEDDDESPEDKAQRKVFESKRKAHYNEYYAVKLARKLMDKDGEEGEGEGDEDDDEDEDSDTKEKADSEPSEKAAHASCKPKSCKPNCTHKHRRHNNNNNAAMPGSSHEPDGSDQV